ncbi:hypothetical protein [Corynebacterium sp. Marseille-P4321]|uniref:hypothetical protein n=1 Tax=Corynebacterium sp. Marseille-P4321 TaxID=2736603 RepID=UPI00158B94F7|nr:hypothetical protein [Corynebacterium sp. Marseille-P4321]
MSSTLYQADHLAPVIRLVERRAGATLMVRVSVVSDEVVYRWVGINETATIGECCEVVAAVFGIDGKVGADAGREQLLIDVLTAPGSATHFSYGLWSFEMQLADTYPRDESTPPSVCVAGSGSFGNTPFNLREVNVRLIGADYVEGVRAMVRPELRTLAARARNHDFFPLLRALDIGRVSRVEGVDRGRLSELPVETELRQRDAFWSVVLAESCCASDPEETARIAESIMAGLGWEGLRGADIRALANTSLTELDDIAGDRPPLEMLDVFRELIRG